MSLNFEITVFSEPQGEAAARVYVIARPTQDVQPEELATLRLSGQIVGPFCRYSTTLQSKLPFKHCGLTECGGRKALIAETLLPDPCYWSSELPFLYRAVGNISELTGGLNPFEQSFGIRSLSAVRRRLTLNSKFWVPRIVADKNVVPTDLSEWRDSGTVMFSWNITPELGRLASETGVHLLAATQKRGIESAEELFQLGRIPAVGMVVASEEFLPLPQQLQTAARNNLLGRGDVSERVESASDAAQFGILFVEDDRSCSEDYLKSKLPLIATELVVVDRLQLSDARSLCDAMQKHLARLDIVPAGFFIN